MKKTQDPTDGTVQDAEDMVRAAQFSIDLRTQGGRALVELMEAQLAERMEQLAKADPFCQGILKVLGHVGYNISLAAGKQAKLSARYALENQ
jgi:hypothetical protein